MSSAPPAFDPRPIIDGLPRLPGVYRMVAADGAVLYVGKARDLKKRVASYFNKGVGPRTAHMLGKVNAIETTVTRSEAEALLLENTLIKSLAPRYNILFRDDKSYPYLCITGETYPQLRFHRGALDRRNRYFGPFPSAGAVRDGIAMLQKVFMLRTCEPSVFANRSRPCMLHQIQRCTAPCVGYVGEAEYQSDVQAAVLFLQGKSDEAGARLKAQMDEAAAALAFERAARLRDKIARLSQLQSRQFVESATAGDVDVVAAVADLSIDKQVTPQKAFAGEQVRYTITVDNLGPSDAPNVVVTDTLPVEVAYEIDTDRCEVVGTDPVTGGQVLRCADGTLAPGDAWTFDVWARVNAATPAYMARGSPPYSKRTPPASGPLMAPQVPAWKKSRLTPCANAVAANFTMCSVAARSVFQRQRFIVASPTVCGMHAGSSSA